MKFKKILFGILVGAITLSFFACSSDDNEVTSSPVNPDAVFPNGIVNSIEKFYDDGSEYVINDIVRDLSGRVISIRHRDCKYDFDYTNSNSVKVIVTFNDGEQWIRTMSLNNSGYISGITEKEDDGIYSAQILYDAQGRINSWTSEYKDSNSTENYKTTIIYDKNGDIIKVEEVGYDKYNGEESIDSSVTSVSYTNSTIKSPLENKGGIMFFDDFFNIDMDEDVCIYYAGLLGKGTTHLPVYAKHQYNSVTADGNYESQSELFATWSINDNGFPTELTIRKDWGSELYKFNW